MKKKYIIKCLFFLGLLLFFTFLPQIIPTSVSIARASEIEKEKNNEARLNLRAITLANGKSFTLRVYNLDKDAKVSFKSADSDIASVSEDGTIIGNKVGSTTITATVRRGLSTTPLTCDITIGPPAFSVKLTRSRTILEVDQSIQLEALIKPINTVESVKFLSRDSSIATVSPGGRVTGKKLGMTTVEAKIDATNPDGSQKSSPCSVIVAKVEDIPLLIDYFTLHPELNDIPEDELSNTLLEIINAYYGEKDIVPNTSLATSALLEAQYAQNAPVTDTSVKTDKDNVAKSLDTDTNVPTPTSTPTSAPTPTPTSTSTPSVAVNTSQEAGETLASTTTTTQATQNRPSLIESLDSNLNSKYQLSELRQKYDERTKIISEVQLSSLYIFGSQIKR